MSYLALARKWRPRDFSQMVGQEHVVRALVNALEHDRLHHAFLFSGTRGVGKTTVARVLAKCLNCEQGTGPRPCGGCRSCTEIDEGRFVDLIEVDAASRTRVDDTRELLDNVQYAPSVGRYKVYLIDEVHMLSNHSFNALLKSLEEPPPHVKFLLATTDPQKVPVTILSRCLQFNLKRLPRQLIVDQLARILESEGVEGEPAALREIARAADGSMRDALSLVDQAVSFGDGRVTAADAADMLGTIDRGHVGAMLRVLAEGDGEALMSRVAVMDEQTPDYIAVLDEFARVLQRVALVQQVPGRADSEDTDAEIVADLAGRIAPEDVQLYYQIALMGKRDLPLAPEPRGGLEMVLLRMLAFRPDDGGTGRPAQETPATPEPGERQERPPPAPERSPTGEAAREDRRAGEEAAAAPDDTGAAATGAQAETDWTAVVQGLGLRGAAQQLAVNCSFSRREGSTVVLELDSAHAQLQMPKAEERLRDALRRFYSEPELRLKIELADGEACTPARREAERDARRREEAVRSVESDPNVRALQETFDARVNRDSIKPVE